MFKINKKDDTATLRVGGEVTIQNASQFRDALKELLGAAQRVEIDFKDVTEMDTAGIQVLLSAQKSCDKMGRNLHISTCSKPVEQVMELYQLKGLFAKGENDGS